MVENMSLPLANGFHVDHYVALAAIVKKTNFSFDLLNFSLDEHNFTYNEDFLVPMDIITTLPAVKAFFYCLYFCIFVIGISGNVLVCYVVFRNKSMHTVTNLFITNLALSDILLCTFAVPFTPLYLFMHEWVFGSMLCHLVPYAQGVSVYISAFTLMSIAIDRFFVIIYPFKPRLPLGFSMMIIFLIWITAGLLTLPYGIFMDLVPSNEGRPYCDEGWPHDSFRKVFGFTTSILQFVIPFFIITFCYLRVCCKLRDRARYKPGANSQRKVELEMIRTRRLNRMLITMVIIFGVSWLPLNIYNLVLDFYSRAATWPYLNAFFFISHSVAMSSTCYNPFLYAWLNENFRKEFKIVLPCYKSNTTIVRNLNSLKQDKTCNGHTTCQETGTAKDIAVTITHPLPEGKPTIVKYCTETDSVQLQMVCSDKIGIAV